MNKGPKYGIFGDDPVPLALGAICIALCVPFTISVGCLAFLTTREFNKAANEIKSQRMHTAIDTSYTKDGKIADIKSETTYHVTTEDLKKLSRYTLGAQLLKEYPKQQRADTLYTKDGKVKDIIKRETFYVVPKAVFDKLGPFL